MVTLKWLNFYYLDHPFHSRNLISIFVSELCDMRHHSHQQRQIIVSLDNTWLQQNVKIMTLYIYDDNEYQQKSEYVLIKETVQQEATFVKDFYLQILSHVSYSFYRTFDHTKKMVSYPYGLTEVLFSDLEIFVSGTEIKIKTSVKQYVISYMPDLQPGDLTCSFRQA